MPTARNDAELHKMLQDPIQKAVQYVVQKIWNENRELVRVMIYEAYTPTRYHRTREFLEAWDYTRETHNPHNSLGYGKFYYKPNSMSVGNYDNPSASDYAQHIGVAGGYKGKSSREYLADILYGEAKWGLAFGNGSFIRQRNVYKELVKRIGKRKLLQWFSEGLSQQGIQYQRHNVGLQVTESN